MGWYRTCCCSGGAGVVISGCTILNVNGNNQQVTIPKALRLQLLDFVDCQTFDIDYEASSGSTHLWYARTWPGTGEGATTGTGDNFPCQDHCWGVSDYGFVCRIQVGDVSTFCAGGAEPCSISLEMPCISLGSMCEAFERALIGTGLQKAYDEGRFTLNPFMWASSVVALDTANFNFGNNGCGLPTGTRFLLTER